MFDKLETVEGKYEELMASLGTTAVQSDANEFRKQSKALAEIEELVQRYREYKAVTQEIAGTEEMIKGGDPEMRDLALEELSDLNVQKERLADRIKILLVPKDPNDDRNVMVEIRAGTGGEEAALFASELYRAYTRYAERQRWKIELLSLSEADKGGVKDVVERAVAGAQRNAGMHRARDVGLGLAHRVHEVGALRQVCRNRGGERAAGAVGIRPRDAGADKLVELAVLKEQVDDLRARQMSALDDDRSRLQHGNATRGFAHVVHRSNRHLREHFGFGNVGGDHAGQAQQRPADGVHGLVVQQVIAALGHHHRVDDQVRQVERLNRGRHRLDDLRGRQHAGLDRVAAEVARDGLDLRGHEVVGQDVDAGDPDGVLGRDRGNGAGAVHAVCRESLEIGLNPGAAT